MKDGTRVADSDNAPDGAPVDVLVIGAGPAGAMAAYAIARAGMSVLLVDRSAFPRTKVCGCCVNARGLDLLARHGLRDRIESLQPHWYSSFHVTGAGVQARLAIPRGAGISRERFDLALVDAAVAAGARFRDRTAASVAQSLSDSAIDLPSRDDAALAGNRTTNSRPPRELLRPMPQVLLTSEGRSVESVRSRVLIVADGLGGAVRRALAVGEQVEPASRIGAGTVVDARPVGSCDDHCINMVVGRSGYVGMVRLEDGRWNVAAAIDPQALKDTHDVGAVINGVLNEAGLPSSSLLAGAAWRGTVPLSRRPFQVAAERTFLIGDAAGYIEPFTGDGIAAALESGALVAPFARRALERWEPEIAAAWTRVLSRHRLRQKWLTTAAAWTVRRPAVARGVLHAVARVPSLAAPVIEWMHQGLVVDEGAVT